MDATDRYWSVDDCCWVKLPAREIVEAAAEVPSQREDEPAREPVEA